MAMQNKYVMLDANGSLVLAVGFDTCAQVIGMLACSFSRLAPKLLVPSRYTCSLPAAACGLSLSHNKIAVALLRCCGHTACVQPLLACV